MKRRDFLSMIVPAASSIVLLPHRTFFLPPREGWHAQHHQFDWLGHLASLYAVYRLPGESDDALRERALGSIKAYSMGLRRA